MFTIENNAHKILHPTAADIGQSVTVYGCLYKIRRMKAFSFLILQTDTAPIQCILDASVAAQCPMPPCEQMRLVVTGIVTENAQAHAGFELRVTDLRILSVPTSPLPIVINGRADVPLETALSHRTASLRREEIRAVFRIRAALSEGCAEFFSQNGFVAIHTPKLCAGTAESGAGVFPVSYFGEDAFLTTSPQLYKQMMVGVFPRVYEIAPVFRAEPHDTARHLNEYTGIDCEVGYLTDLRTLMEIESAMLTHALAYVRQHAGNALAVLSVLLPRTDTIPALSFYEAKALLRTEYPAAFSNTDDLTPPEEKALSAYAKTHFDSDFLFVTEYPTAKRPFYTRENASDPTVTESFDLLFRGIEITTGGLRIHEYEAQCEKMHRFSVDPASFSDYLSAHRYGLPPHGGFGLGLERLCAALCGFENVRHASLFPRDVGRLTP